MDDAVCAATFQAYSPFEQHTPPPPETPEDIVEDVEGLKRLAQTARQVREKLKPLHMELEMYTKTIEQETNKDTQSKEAFSRIKKNNDMSDTDLAALEEMMDRVSCKRNQDITRLEGLRDKTLTDLQYLVSLITSLQTDSDIKLECPICFNMTVSHAYVPCGHTVCLECSLRNTHNCHTCRFHIEKTIKLYLPGER